MQMFEISAIAALIGMGGFVLLYTRQGGALVATAWVWPAGLSAVFFVFSAVALVQDGLWPIWFNHTQDLWGNQVWFDLLIGFSISWVLLMGEGHRLGVRPWPWLLTLFLTGNIGLLAMLARILYLRENSVVSAKAAV